MFESAATLLERIAQEADEVFFVYSHRVRRFEYVNRAFERMTGRSGDDFIKNPAIIYEMIHKDDLAYLKKSIADFLIRKTKLVSDFRLVCDEREQWIRLKVYPVLDGDRLEYAAGLAEDDTARKANIFYMQKINGWKDSMINIVAHDLQGPINIVRNLASVIDSKFPEDGDKQVHEWARMIRDISERNITLIRDLLKNESLESPMIATNKERLDMVWEIRQATDMYIKSQGDISKKIEFSSSHDQVYAEVDSIKFLQIVNNLVSNAIKFTRDDGVIKLRLEKLESTAIITVEDNGIGIPKSLQPQLFLKYTKAARPGLKGEDPVGLGTWIVKTLTEAHGGKVWFESEENKGSKFYVQIPLGR